MSDGFNSFPFYHLPTWLWLCPHAFPDYYFALTLVCLVDVALLGTCSVLRWGSVTWAGGGGLALARALESKGLYREMSFLSSSRGSVLLDRPRVLMQIVLRNCCINPWPEKCILGQIPIYCQEYCSEQLKCFQVSSSTMSLGS